MISRGQHLPGPTYLPKQAQGGADLSQLLQAAVQDPALDSICPGKTRSSAHAYPE